MYAPAEYPGPVQTRRQGRAHSQDRDRSTAAHGQYIATTAWLEPEVEIAIELPCSVAPDLFFAERPEEIRQARALCQQCPARGPCLEGALARAEPWGVWGGELIMRGGIIPTKRARGRPRRAAILSGLPEAVPARS